MHWYSMIVSRLIPKDTRRVSFVLHMHDLSICGQRRRYRDTRDNLQNHEQDTKAQSFSKSPLSIFCLEVAVWSFSRSLLFFSRATIARSTSAGRVSSAFLARWAGEVCAYQH